MKKAKNPKTSVQRDKFIEIARSLGCDESESAFDKKLGKLAGAKPQAPAPKKGKKKK